MSDSTNKETAPPRKRKGPDTTNARTLLARIVWIVALVCASVLALAAILIVLEASTENQLVEFIGNFGAAVDLEVFARKNPIIEFDGDNGFKKEAVVNYGLGAVAYVLVGRILERVIRP